MEYLLDILAQQKKRILKKENPFLVFHFVIIQLLHFNIYYFNVNLETKSCIDIACADNS